MILSPKIKRSLERGLASIVRGQFPTLTTLPGTGSTMDTSATGQHLSPIHVACRGPSKAVCARVRQA
jgi:hypothetical protein